MLRSLYSGVTGLKSQQTKMDVISNNISNVSTTGFKAGRVRFEDMISQVNASAQGATDNRGGVNAQEVGLGVQTTGIDTIMGSGSLQTTGRALDFGIQNGDNSFFRVRAGEQGGEIQYTRDGAFYTDEDNHLVTSGGLRVLDDEGNAITIALGENQGELQNFNIDNTGAIIGTNENGQTFTIARIGLTSFANPDGLEKAGGNVYNASANSGDPIDGAPTDPGFGEIRSGFLEMSNVDLANEFTEMIVTSRAYQANSRSITTSDEMLQELLSLKR